MRGQHQPTGPLAIWRATFEDGSCLDVISLDAQAARQYMADNYPNRVVATVKDVSDEYRDELDGEPTLANWGTPKDTTLIDSIIKSHMEEGRA